LLTVPSDASKKPEEIILDVTVDVINELGSDYPDEQLNEISQINSIIKKNLRAVLNMVLSEDFAKLTNTAPKLKPK